MDSNSQINTNMSMPRPASMSQESSFPFLPETHLQLPASNYLLEDINSFGVMMNLDDAGVGHSRLNEVPWTSEQLRDDLNTANFKNRESFHYAPSCSDPQIIPTINSRKTTLSSDSSYAFSQIFDPPSVGDADYTNQSSQSSSVVFGDDLSLRPNNSTSGYLPLLEQARKPLRPNTNFGHDGGHTTGLPSLDQAENQFSSQKLNQQEVTVQAQHTRPFSECQSCYCRCCFKEFRFKSELT